MTLVVGPCPEPTYEPVNDEIARTRPDTQVSSWPQPQTCSKERDGLG